MVIDSTVAKAQTKTRAQAGDPNHFFRTVRNGGTLKELCRGRRLCQDKQGDLSGKVAIESLSRISHQRVPLLGASQAVYAGPGWPGLFTPVRLPSGDPAGYRPLAALAVRR